jgi:hypothetical protein
LHGTLEHLCIKVEQTDDFSSISLF